GVARPVGELAASQEQAMVSPGEADGVRGGLRRSLADEDHWILAARRLSWPQTVLHGGVWVAVVAVARLVWRGREALSPPERWLLPAGGFVLLLVSGLGLRAREQLAASAVFLAGAVLVAAPALLAVFAELGWFAGRPEGPAQLFGPPYANDQVFVATGFAAALSAAALFLLRSTALAWTTAALAAAAYLSW